MNEEGTNAGNTEPQNAPATSNSVPAFLPSSLNKKSEEPEPDSMNEEGRKAAGTDAQSAPASPDSIPADQPSSLNQENVKQGELELEELTGCVIGCAIAVHRELGPGFVEGLYENALIVEFRHTGIPFQSQGEKPIFYRGELVGIQRFDLLVAGQLVLELKAIKALEDIHFAQVRSYLKALHLKHGLRFNFASMPLTIKRVIYGSGDSGNPT